MVARLKLKDIDGRAPPGDLEFASTPGYNLVNPPLWGGEAFELRGLSGHSACDVPAAKPRPPGLGPQIKWWPVGSFGAH